MACPHCGAQVGEPCRNPVRHQYPRAYTAALPEGARVVIKSDPYHQHPTPGLCVVASGVEQFLGCRA